MRKISLPSLQETLYETTHSSGLQIYYMPKEDYNKTYATLSTNFGSTGVYMKDTQGIQSSIPEGVAHFLEHKLFEQDGEDVSEAFSSDQASVNAFTSNHGTTYLFSCTDHVKHNLKRLLRFVLNPSFTEAGIKKEIPIIAEEIMMYQDSHHTRMYLETLKNMYHHHPVKNDILGTVDSIGKINLSLLNKVHNAYYHPSQMVLFVIGHFDLSDIDRSISKLLTSMSFEQIMFPDDKAVLEPSSVFKTEGTIEMDILLPDILIGIKLPPSKNVLKEELIYSMILQEFFSQTSTFYQSLLEQNIINDSYGYDLSIHQSYGNIVMGSETASPNELADLLIHYTKSVSSKTMSEDSFKRMKRQLTGHFIQSLNHLEYIANQFTKYRFLEEDIFGFIETMNSITIDDIHQFMQHFAKEDIFTTTIVWPTKK